MRRIIEFFVKQSLFGDLLTVFVIVVGIIATLLIRRDAFPNVTFDVITIATLYPGASPEEVEKLVTNPIEQDLKEVDGIKILTSTSIEGRSYIVAQLDPDQTTSGKAKDDIQNIVDRLTDMPESSEKPVVTLVESKLTPIIEVSLSGPIGNMELREASKKLRDEIETVRGVARVVPDGLRDLEIHVIANPAKLSQYRLSLEDLINALKKQNLNIPGGTLEPSADDKKQIEIFVRTVGEFQSPEDVKKTVVKANDIGQSITVGQIAEVSYALKKATTLTRTDGINSIRLTVLKKEKADAINVVDDLKAHIEKVRGILPPNTEVTYVNDFSYYVKRRLSILSSNLVFGLILVLIVLSFLLPFRVALLVSVGIPFGFLGAMIYFQAMGFSINLISMLGLIIVSGMLVDDAIVVTDNAVRHMQNGLPAKEAAILGAIEVMPAVTASVMTTVVVFLPMLFMSGIFGKFMFQVPLGVIIPLLVSLFEAFFILPGHIGKFINVHEVKAYTASTSKGIKGFLERVGQAWESKLIPKYTGYLTLALKNKYKMAGVALLIFVSSLVLATKFMHFVLFPPDGVEIFFVRAQTPTGTQLEMTSQLMVPLEEHIQTLPKEELERMVTRVGIHQQDGNDPTTKRGSEFGQIAVFLTPETKRNRTALEIIESLKKSFHKPEGIEKVTFERVKTGPPVGRALDVGVRGAEYPDILKGTEELKRKLVEIPGLLDVSDSYLMGKKEFRISINSSEAAAAGLSVAAIGNSVRAAFEGVVATSIQRLDEDIDVRVSLPESSKTKRSTLLELQVPNMMGNLVRLGSVSRISESQSIAVYEHEDHERQVRVSSDVDTEVISAIAANDKVKAWIPELQKQFPKLKFFFGGEDRDTKESLASLGRTFGLAILGVFLILILTFKNLIQPFLVLFSIPLGIIAVILAFAIHRMPLSFLGVLGIIALSGVIVNNAIVFIDFVNQQRASGMERTKSIITSAQIRLRPIFLTTITTVFGVLPTAYGIGGLDKFVVPIAMALGWGLMFGSVLTACFFPVAIAIADDLSDFLKKVPASFSSRRA